MPKSLQEHAENPVEEFIRFAGSIHGIPRTVTADVEVSGHRFAATDEPAAFHGNAITRGYTSVPVIFTPGVRAA